MPKCKHIYTYTIYLNVIFKCTFNCDELTLYSNFNLT